MYTNTCAGVSYTIEYLAYSLPRAGRAHAAIRDHESMITQLIRRRDVRLITHAVVRRIFGRIFSIGILRRDILTKNPYLDYLNENPR